MALIQDSTGTTVTDTQVNCPDCGGDDHVDCQTCYGVGTLSYSVGAAGPRWHGKERLPPRIFLALNQWVSDVDAAAHWTRHYIRRTLAAVDVVRAAESRNALRELGGW